MKLTQGDRQRTSEQVVTPSTHMQVIQGVESANQLLPSVCSSPPYIQPEREDQITGKPFFKPAIMHFQLFLYPDSEDSRLLDQPSGAYTLVADTQETHTEPHLPARHRLALKNQERYERVKREGWRSQTWQVQVEQWFELGVQVCPSLNSCPSTVQTVSTDGHETEIRKQSEGLHKEQTGLKQNKYHQFVLQKLQVGQQFRSTCALRAALAWLGNWSNTRRLWADEGYAGDGASDTRAALAGVRGRREGVGVGMDNTLI